MWSVGVVLVEIFTGKLIYPGHDNNGMIKYFLDYWGAPAKRVLKRGAFSSIYFDDEGLFLHRALDPQLGRTVTRKLKIVKTTRELLSFIAAAAAGPDDRDLLLLLKDLLDQMFVLDPQRRITPTTALNHRFCARTDKD